MPLKFFYIAIFLSAFMYEDLSNIELIKLGGLNIYLADVLNLLIIAGAVKFLLLKSKPQLAAITAFYFFLGWIVMEVLMGLPRYGFRAIGEVRMLSNYFAFFLPFILVYPKDDFNAEKLIQVCRNTLLVAAIATLLMFVIEVSIGGRFFISSNMQNAAGGLEDFRGIRILNSNHAFHLSAVIVLLVLHLLLGNAKDMTKLIVAFILLFIVLYSKNRTAVVAIVASFGIWMAFKGYFKLIIISVISIFALFILMSVISPGMYEQVKIAFGGVTNISEDATGKFRLLIQAAAIQHGLEHPIMGEGIGNYFDYYIPELGITYDVPPHSMFVYMFQKTGIIGTILSIVPVILLCIAINKIQKNSAMVLSKKMLIYLNLFFVLILAQLFYGFAYNYSIFYGLYAGFASLLIITLQKEHSTKSLITNEEQPS